jgi:predicted acetyltransferase
MKLVLPTSKYRETFLAGIKEIQNVETNPKLRELRITPENFDEQVKRYQNDRRGINLKKDFVPSTTYWLIDKNEFIGRTQIRHELNKSLAEWGGHIGFIIRPSKRKLGYGTKILALALTKAKKMGIEKALITCDKSNIGSKKIIEKNGGVLQDEYDPKDGSGVKLRYWINIK